MMQKKALKEAGQVAYKTAKELEKLEYDKFYSKRIKEKINKIM